MEIGVLGAGAIVDLARLSFTGLHSFEFDGAVSHGSVVSPTAEGESLYPQVSVRTAKERAGRTAG